MSARFDLDAEIDGLFRGPLDHFTAARNVLASRLRADGQVATAAIIKSLVKPSISAWAVNQVRWQAARAFDGVIRAGDGLRAAQQARLAGRASDDLEKAARSTREALAVATAAAVAALSDAGPPPGAAVRQRIATTLEALATHGSTRPDLLAGRLSRDLDPPGFEVVRSLAPSERSPQRPPLRLVRSRAAAPASRVKPALARARTRAMRARDAAVVHRRTLNRIETEKTTLARTVAVAADRAAAAERHRNDAVATLDAAKHRLNQVTRKFDRAAADLARAERENAAAQVALARAGDRHPPEQPTSGQRPGVPTSASPGRRSPGRRGKR